MHEWFLFTTFYEYCCSGLQTHPQRELAARQMTGFSGLMSFTFDSRVTREAIRLFLSELKAFANKLLLYSFLVSLLGNCLLMCKIYGYNVFNLQIFALAESFGATESLVEMPYDVIKAIAFNNNDSLCSICLFWAIVVVQYLHNVLYNYIYEYSLIAEPRPQPTPRWLVRKYSRSVWMTVYADSPWASRTLKRSLRTWYTRSTESLSIWKLLFDIRGNYSI